MDFKFVFLKKTREEEGFQRLPFSPKNIMNVGVSNFTQNHIPLLFAGPT